MKRLMTMVMWAAVSCLVLAPAAMAQDGGGRRGDGERGGRRGGDGARQQRGERDGARPQREGDARRPMRDPLMRALGELKLTDEQEAQVKETMQKFQEETKADREKAMEQFRSLRQQMEEARKAENKEKVQELEKQVRELMEKGMESRKQLREKLRGVLTEEQNAKLDQLLQQRREGPGAGGDVILKNAEQLGLSDDQKARIQELNKAYSEAMTKIREGEGEREAKMTQARELSQKLREDIGKVLTEEQQKKLRELMAQQRPGGRDGEGVRRGPRDGDAPRRGPRDGENPRRGGGDRPAPAVEG